MPSVSEHSVICPVGRKASDRHHGDIVDKEHNKSKNGKTEPPVCNNPVNFIGGRQLTLILFLIAGLDYLGDVYVPFICDD